MVWRIKKIFFCFLKTKILFIFFFLFKKKHHAVDKGNKIAFELLLPTANLHFTNTNKQKPVDIAIARRQVIFTSLLSDAMKISKCRDVDIILQSNGWTVDYGDQSVSYEAECKLLSVELTGDYHYANHFFDKGIIYMFFF